MRVAGTLSSSLINGEGIRYVIFLQGCNRHCEGCHNPDTWDLNGGREVSVDTLVRDIRNRMPFIDGITLSGGEPFLQEDECMQLLMDLPVSLNVWLYTGYEYEEIKDRLLARTVDYIVCGPFEKDKQIVGKFYGSSNQRIIDVKKGTVVSDEHFE